MALPHVVGYHIRSDIDQRIGGACTACRGGGDQRYIAFIACCATSCGVCKFPTLSLYWPDDSLSHFRSVEAVPLERHDLMLVPSDLKGNGSELQYWSCNNELATSAPDSWIREIVAPKA
ncbi:MAG: hypothetical protein JNM85_04115 [Chthonomonas sp.]|nr:hypothetical protein [Chthonomonas sp.]